MPRRSNWLLDLMAVTGRWPWWVGFLLAMAFFLGLHQVAGLPVTSPTSLDGFPALIAQDGVHFFASAFEYILPIVFMFGTLGGVIQRRRGRSLLAAAESDPSGTIERISWRDFERLVGASFEAQGYRVTRTGGNGADGGIDLVLEKDRKRTLVQCKQWRSRTVGVATVRELFGVMAAQGAAKGIVVTVGEFTTDARDFAKGRNLELLNGRALAEILRGGSTAAGSPVPETTSPACPTCGSPMVQRVARKGPSAGNAFWGCSKYPGCRGTVAIGSRIGGTGF